ncbi:MAG: hypothetical protein AAB254_02110, partial [candidate division NC10 bacterium]
MTDTHATRLRRICRRLPQLLGRAARLMLALMLVPSLAWGQTMDEMKQMLQQLLEQNKALQYNFNNPRSQANRLRVFDEKANTFRFNSAELNVSKPSTVESPWGFGLTLNLCCFKLAEMGRKKEIGRPGKPGPQPSAWREVHEEAQAAFLSTYRSL